MARLRDGALALLALGLVSLGLTTLGAAGIARADDTQTFSPAQRAEIVAIVRQALKTDPSILRDAVTTLRADEARQQAASQDSAIGDHRAEIIDGKGDAVAGNSVGDVTVTEFYDPRCPYCKRMLPTIDAAIAADRKLRVVYKIIPILGPQSVTEARAIVAAGMQGNYIGMQKALMSDAAPATDSEIASLAASQHLDPARLAHDMQSPAVTSHINDNIALAKALHVDGTPALVIGSQMVPGALDLGDLQRAVGTARG